MQDIVSLIVVAWNGRPYLGACLDSIQMQLAENDELILVDNGSTDGAALELAAERPWIRLIRNHRNLGVAGGFNTGVELAQGKVIVLVNQDIILMTGCIYNLVQYLNDHSEVGISGCKLMSPDQQTIQHAGALIRMPSGDPIQIGRWEQDRGQYARPIEADYVTGAVIAFRKKVWSEVGGFDERFYPAYYEDADFCRQARQAGYKVVYIPQAVAIHYEATSVGRLSWKHYFAHHSNRLRFVFKHLSIQEILSEFLTEELKRLDDDFSENEARALRIAYQSNDGYATHERERDKAIEVVLAALCHRVDRRLSIVTDAKIASRLILS